MKSIINRINNLSLYIFVFGVNFEYWDPLGLEGVFSIAKMTAIIYLISWFPLIRSLTFLRLKYFLVPLVLYLMVEFFSSAFNSIYVEGILEAFNLKVIQLLLVLILVVNHITREPEMLGRILNIYVLSVILLGLLSMMGIGIEVTANLDDRLLLFGENPNMVGMKAAFAINILFYYLLNSKNKWLKIVYILMTIPLFSMLIASGSRGALLSIFLGIGVMVLLQNYSKVKKFFLLFVSLLLSTSLFNYIMITNEGLNRRMTYFLEEGQTGRNVIWEAALEIIKSNIVIGVGRPGALPVMKQYLGRAMETHNVFLHVLVTTGIIGFMFFMTFILRLMVRLYKKYRLEKNIIFIVLYVILLFNMFKSGGFINKTFLWLFFAVLISSTFINGNILRDQIKKQ